MTNKDLVNKQPSSLAPWMGEFWATVFRFLGRTALYLPTVVNLLSNGCSVTFLPFLVTQSPRPVSPRTLSQINYSHVNKCSSQSLPMLGVGVLAPCLAMQEALEAWMNEWIDLVRSSMNLVNGISALGERLPRRTMDYSSSRSDNMSTGKCLFNYKTRARS